MVGYGNVILILMTSEPDIAVPAIAAGVDYIVIDREKRGKAARQNGTDFDQRTGNLGLVRIMSQDLGLPVIVRIDSVGRESGQQIEELVELGVEGAMLPMASSALEAQEFLDLVAGRLKTIVQIETSSAVDDIDRIASLGWDILHFGLNDLSLSLRRRDIWEVVADGSMSRWLQPLSGRRYGFGGATILSGGCPIPSPLVLGTMAGLGCGAVLLRRSFIRDCPVTQMPTQLAKMRGFLEVRLLDSSAARAEAYETSLAQLSRIVLGNHD